MIWTSDYHEDGDSLAHTLSVFSSNLYKPDDGNCWEKLANETSVDLFRAKYTVASVNTEREKDTFSGNFQ